jgi:hypothetical protein
LCKLDAELFRKGFRCGNAIVDAVDMRLLRDNQCLCCSNCEQEHNNANDARNQTDSTAFWRGAIDESKA